MSEAGRPGFAQLWRHREVRGLLLAQVISDGGDQVARIALALLVFHRSHSVIAAAATLAVTFIPGAVASLTLGSLADRFPRRTVMLSCDVLRALVISGLAVIAVSTTPLLALLGLLLVSELATGPFASARAALYGDILTDQTEFSTAQAAGRLVSLGMQVVGFILGGVVVELLGARTVLALDGLTFVAAFVIVRTHVRPRPSADEGGTSARRILSDLRFGVDEVIHDPLKGPLIFFAWASTLYFGAPEAIAVGYHGSQSATTSGFLLAAAPAGSFVGAALISQLRLPDQVRFMLPMAAMSCVALFATSIDPPALVAFVLWFVAGVMTAFMITIITATVQLTLPKHRGRVVGVAFAGFNVAFAVSYLLVSWVAEALDPARAVSLAGAVGLVFVTMARASWRQDKLVKVLENLATQPVIALVETVAPTDVPEPTG